MPKYLFQANYTAQGIQGLLKEEAPRANGFSKKWPESRAGPWSRSITPSAGPTCI